MIFTNKRYFTRQTFEIGKSSLKINRRNLFENIEHEISFDHIGNKKKIQTVFNNNLFVTGLFFLTIGLICFFAGNEPLTAIICIFSLIFFVTAFANRKKIITISTYTGEIIELFFTSKNKTEITGYADKIILAANNYLYTKYSKIDKDLPAEPQIEHLLFLRDREILDEKEFEYLKDQLLKRDNRKNIGFM